MSSPIYFQDSASPQTAGQSLNAESAGPTSSNTNTNTTTTAQDTAVGQSTIAGQSAETATTNIDEDEQAFWDQMFDGVSLDPYMNFDDTNFLDDGFSTSFISTNDSTTTGASNAAVLASTPLTESHNHLSSSQTTFSDSQFSSNPYNNTNPFRNDSLNSVDHPAVQTIESAGNGSDPVVSNHESLVSDYVAAENNSPLTHQAVQVPVSLSQYIAAPEPAVNAQVIPTLPATSIQAPPAVGSLPSAAAYQDNPDEIADFSYTTQFGFDESSMFDRAPTPESLRLSTPFPADVPIPSIEAPDFLQGNSSEIAGNLVTGNPSQTHSHETITIPDDDDVVHEDTNTDEHSQAHTHNDVEEQHNNEHHNLIDNADDNYHNPHHQAEDHGHHRDENRVTKSPSRTRDSSATTEEIVRADAQHPIVPDTRFIRGTSVLSTDTSFDAYEYLSENPDDLKEMLKDHPILLLNFLGDYPGMTSYRRTSRTTFNVEVAIDIPCDAQHLLNRRPRFIAPLSSMRRKARSGHSSRPRPTSDVQSNSHLYNHPVPATSQKPPKRQFSTVDAADDHKLRKVRRTGDNQPQDSKNDVKVIHDKANLPSVTQHSSTATTQQPLPSAAAKVCPPQLSQQAVPKPRNSAIPNPSPVSVDIKPRGNQRYIDVKMKNLAAIGVSVPAMIMTKSGKRPFADKNSTLTPPQPVVTNKNGAVNKPVTSTTNRSATGGMNRSTTGVQANQPKVNHSKPAFYGITPSYAPPPPRPTPAQRARQEALYVAAMKTQSSPMTRPSINRMSSSSTHPGASKLNVGSYSTQPAALPASYSNKTAPNTVAPRQTMLSYDDLDSMAPASSTTTSLPAATKGSNTSKLAPHIATHASDDSDSRIPYPAPKALIDQSRRLPATATWRLFEQDLAIGHMLDIRNEDMVRGEKRFEEVSQRLLRDNGVNRTLNGVKNFWNRIGRARSGFDERKNKSAPLATSKQGKKAREVNAVKKTTSDVLASGDHQNNKRKRHDSVEEEEHDTKYPFQRSTYLDDICNDDNVSISGADDIDIDLLRSTQTGLRPRKRLHLNDEF